MDEKDQRQGTYGDRGLVVGCDAVQAAISDIR